MCTGFSFLGAFFKKYPINHSGCILYWLLGFECVHGGPPLEEVLGVARASLIAMQAFDVNCIQNLLHQRLSHISNHLTLDI
jgi:hypothetical protein